MFVFYCSAAYAVPRSHSNYTALILSQCTVVYYDRAREYLVSKCSAESLRRSVEYRISNISGRKNISAKVDIDSTGKLRQVNKPYVFRGIECIVASHYDERFLGIHTVGCSVPCVLNVTFSRAKHSARAVIAGSYKCTVCTQEVSVFVKEYKGIAIRAGVLLGNKSVLSGKIALYRNVGSNIIYGSISLIRSYTVKSHNSYRRNVCRCRSHKGCIFTLRIGLELGLLECIPESCNIKCAESYLTANKLIVNLKRSCTVGEYRNGNTDIVGLFVIYRASVKLNIYCSTG